MPRLFLLFSHSLSDAQAEEARESLGVSGFVPLPEGMAPPWGGIDPAAESCKAMAAPYMRWLDAGASPGDFVLVQGDYGMTFLMVNYAFARGLVPVYATTEREHSQSPGEGGAVVMTKKFRHVRFRRYER